MLKKNNNQEGKKIILPPHFLVVDDDDRLRELLETYLEQQGFIVTTAEDAYEAQEIMKEIHFDLFILDIMMPGQTGYELCEVIRRSYETPILFLSAKGEIEDKLQGFEKGGDDYLQKPFEPRELTARAEALLKRSKVQKNLDATKEVSFGQYRFDFTTEILFSGEAQIFLTETERKLLKIFFQNPFLPQSRETLVNIFPGSISLRSIDVQIARLRRKIEKDPKHPRYLQTNRHKGYVFIPEGIDLT